MRARRVLIGAAAALVLVAGCSSDSGSSSVGGSAPDGQDAESTEATSVTEPQDDADALDSICDLVSAEDVNGITGLTLVLRTDSSFRAGPPYDRCSWESPEGNVVVASIWARSLVSEGVASPDEWWTRNLQPLEDAVAEVRPLLAFGEHAYLATDDTTVDVLWFPAPDTYVEAGVAATGWPTAQQPPPEEVERMAVELSELFVERLEPHLPLPEPERD